MLLHYSHWSLLFLIHIKNLTYMHIVQWCPNICSRSVLYTIFIIKENRELNKGLKYYRTLPAASLTFLVCMTLWPNNKMKHGDKCCKDICTFLLFIILVYSQQRSNSSYALLSACILLTDKWDVLEISMW